jgi:hypothetical protein
MTTISELKASFTKITEGTDEDDRPCFNVWLVVDHQSFCVTPIANETRKEAEWTCQQLAIALHRLVKEMKTV